MTKREFAARLVLLLIVVGLPTSVLVYQLLLRPAMNGNRVIEITAAIPENGGFQPDSIQVNAGEMVTLRFTAADVIHGIAIGPGLGVDLGEIEPGHTQEITLTFDQAGTYTFYCNTWCSLNHWRMRGVIAVSDPQQPEVIPTARPDAVIQALAAEGVNIDDPPGGQALMLAQPLSSQRGRDLAAQFNLPAELQDVSWQRSQTPLQALALLRTQNPAADASDLADVIAYVWTKNATSADLTTAADLYAKNCAACHGETGDGKGIMAGQLAATPVAFADANVMFGRRSDVLYAKIRRGGMGTDMPNFGTLFTPEETWALVDYLWSLTVEQSSEAASLR